MFIKLENVVHYGTLFINPREIISFRIELDEQVQILEQVKFMGEYYEAVHDNYSSGEYKFHKGRESICSEVVTYKEMSKYTDDIDVLHMVDEMSKRSRGIAFKLHNLTDGGVWGDIYSILKPRFKYLQLLEMNIVDFKQYNRTYNLIIETSKDNYVVELANEHQNSKFSSSKGYEVSSEFLNIPEDITEPEKVINHFENVWYSKFTNNKL